MGDAVLLSQCREIKPGARVQASQVVSNPGIAWLVTILGEFARRSPDVAEALWIAVAPS